MARAGRRMSTSMHVRTPNRPAALPHSPTSFSKPALPSTSLSTPCSRKKSLSLPTHARTQPTTILPSNTTPSPSPMATVFSLLSSGSLLGKATASASGGVLVMTTGGLMSAPRLMLVPAATRLPSGVHAVVPVQASGRRRAMPVAARADSGYTADGDQVSFDMFKAKAYKVVPVQAGALPGAAASGRRRAMPMAAGGEWAYTDEEDHYKNSDLSLKKFVKTKASEALGLIQKNLPLDEHLLAEWNKIEDDLHFAALVEGIGDTKTAVVEYVLTLIGAAYDIVNYTNRCYLSTRPTPHYQIKIQGATSSPPPSSGTPFVALKDGTFLAFDFGPGNHDTSRMVLAINRAMYLATAATDAYLNTI